MGGNISSLYEPINEYKPITARIGIVDGPLEYVAMLRIKLPRPFPTRMTVVKLTNGDLFLHSPVAFNSALARRLQPLGDIRHLVSPNRGHYAHIGEWARQYPDAVSWASPLVRERAHSQGIHINFDRDLGPDAPREWCDEIDKTILCGAVLDEIIFFHRESMTLILADAIMNFEPEKMRQAFRRLALRRIRPFWRNLTRPTPGILAKEA